MKKFNVLTTYYLREAIDKRKQANEALRAKAKKALRRTVLALVVTCGSFLLVVVCSILVVKKISAWYDTHTLVVKKPIEVYVKKNKIVNVTKREPEVKVVGVEDAQKMIEESGNPDIASYIFEKFGNTYGAVALAVFKAESGLREDAFNINTNGTIDVGVTMINSVHFSKEGCSLKEVATWKGNIDCAYGIFEAHGKKFDAWVAYTRNMHLAHME